MQRYAITDRSLLAPHPGGWEAALRARVAQWIGDGIEWIQLREKNLPESILAALVCALAALARAPGSQARLVINGLPPSLAMDSGAHGVHLRGGSTGAQVRAATAVCEFVSVSCHTLPEVAVACSGGASAILWAPVFGKAVGGVEVQPGTGLPTLRVACQTAVPVPVFALGGVTASNAASCLQAGAAGVAGIRLFHDEGWRGLREAT